MDWHPIFFGSFDWHSCVHGYWTLATVLRLYPGMAEAEAVRDVVLARYPDPAQGRFLICGDWNDTRNSKPVRALTKRGDRELGVILPAADPRGETWTHFYRKEDTYSRIDYFLVSPALQPATR